jgi:hypothetical protein
VFSAQSWFTNPRQLSIDGRDRENGFLLELKKLGWNARLNPNGNTMETVWDIRAFKLEM